MQLFEGNLLHVYNRGNNKQPIFFEEDNYRFFLDKVQKHIGSVSDILAYCLMPNHFHFLVHVNELSCKEKTIGALQSTELQNGFRILQSSYAGAINRQFSRTGSLFQQNTKYKLLNAKTDGEQLPKVNYAEVCFHYIHQNPLKAGLVNKLEDWPYSSFADYLLVNDGISNMALATKKLDLDTKHFYETSYAVIREDVLDRIW